MTLEDMTDLIIVYDGLRDIEKITSILMNESLVVGYEHGAIGKLSRVFDVIYRNSVLYDIDASELSEVTNSSGMSFEEIINLDIPAEKRAKILFK